MKIYIMGIKGVAMSGLAKVLVRMKATVMGSDTSESFATEKVLKKYGVVVYSGFSPEHITPDLTALIITGAHGGHENIEVKRARELKIPVYTHAQFVGQLMKDFEQRIAVIGSHGKTTITAMISYCLQKTGECPTYLVGTSDFSGLDAAHYGGRKYFVIEGDEYGNAPPKDIRPRFSFFDANWVVCPNIDFDHPDIYKDLNDVKSKIFDYYTARKPYFIANGDDLNFNSLDIPLNKKSTYGFMDHNELVIYDVQDQGETKFRLSHAGRDLGEWELGIPGRQNIANAASVVLLFIKLGLDLEKLRPVITGYVGARRRFEKICDNSRHKVYDDYAHHPKEIEETVKAIKNYFVHKKCLIVFQPHTYSRTHALLPDFVEALHLADEVIVTDIFSSARENKADFPVESDSIEKEAIKKGYANIRYVPMINLADEIEKVSRDYDVIFTMGAGNLYDFHKKMCESLSVLTIRDLTKNVSLKKYNTFQLESLAEYFYEVKSTDEIVGLVNLARENNLKLTFISGGSNVVLSENISGIVVLNRTHEMKTISQTDTEIIIEVNSGYPVIKLANELMNDGISGFEWFVSLPGSLGGAIYMNSKWMNTEKHFIGDHLISARVLDREGNVKTVTHDYFEFDYGYSSLQKNNEILLSAQFKLERKPSDEMKKIARRVIDYRLSTQPHDGFSAGCIFKNPKDVSAGKLIDDAGLKGKSVGDFFVSEKHANFIINRGNGKIEDLKALIAHVKKAVLEKSGVTLETEVNIVA